MDRLYKIIYYEYMKDLNKNMVLRPEIRHDWAKPTNGTDKFFGNVPHVGPSTATDNKQTTISADLLFYF